MILSLYSNSIQQI